VRCCGVSWALDNRLRSSNGAKVDWLQRIVKGDRRTIARTITTIENEPKRAESAHSALAPHLGRAHVVGITGPAGAGKSTLVNALVGELLRRGHTVGVVAIDPSSPFSGGAVLGDRIRMAEHQANERVFIRSLASRGHAGGLSTATAQAVDVLDAAGFEFILVETVGAGQSDVAIARLARTRVVVYPPGLGDEVQALKAGVLEIADIFVVNKADLPGAESTARDLLSVPARRQRESKRPVLKIISTTGEGVENLADVIAKRASTQEKCRESSVNGRAA
jgi:LAO/AO transport system kinase